MSEHALISLASIVILGMSAQWLAWRLKFPSILFLLIFGFIAGPLTGFLHPDELMGDLLMPFVSLSVAIILFEGGLTLRIRELREIGKVLLSLISVGVVVTWAIATLTAHYLLKINFQISVLLGAILVVTGPTVIGPLLRHIRPSGKVGDILKWEGIVIDPIGAMLAILVFEAILAGEVQQATALVLLSIGKTIVFGGMVGFLFAWFLVLLLKRFWIPDDLQETVTLTLVIVAYLISELLQPESGLFAATLMGLVLDNQRLVAVKHIEEFKENLRVLIIAILFIILSARLHISDFSHCSVMSLVFLAILIVVARPVSVLISTIRSQLNWRERLFLSWLAPRGIVAAAISSIFALRLAETGIQQIEYLVPLTFIVIVGTVVIYGLTSPLVAHWFKIAQSNPQGVLIVGAHSWSQAIAKAIQGQNFKVAMIDTNRNNIYQARMKGIPANQGSGISKRTLDKIPLDGIGKLLALTSNDEANSMAALHFDEVFEREELYQLLPKSEDEGGEEESYSPQHLRARFLFGKGMNYHYLNNRFLKGSNIKSTRITEEFDYNAFKRYYGESSVPLFLITEDRSLVISTTDTPVEPKQGQVIIALVDEKENN